MSHAATNWAIKQRGLKPAAKVVLWYLCDRHNPDHGCFPAQDTLALDCEMPRSTLNRYLDSLEAGGHIRRQKRIDKESGKHKSTKYLLGFEYGFTTAKKEAENPCRNSGDGKESVSQNTRVPCPILAENRVPKLDTNPVIEPVIEPVSNICSSLDGFEEFWNVYDFKKSRFKCEEIWIRKHLASRALAIIEGAAAYSASRGSNPKYWKHPQGWLNDERWTDEIRKPVSQHSNTIDAVDQAAMLAERSAS